MLACSRRLVLWLGCLLGSACFGESPAIETGSSDDGGMCPEDLVAPGLAACPAACTGGCESDNVCTIACSGEAACADLVLACPAEYECKILCSGIDACDGATVNCPSDLPCALVCEGGSDACGDSTVNCGSGECSVQCGAIDSVCSGTTILCGSGACLASCAENSFPLLENCDESCACERCVAS